MTTVVYYVYRGPSKWSGLGRHEVIYNMIIATYLKEWQSTLVYPIAGDTNQTREIEYAKLFFYGTFLKSHMVYGLSMEIHVSISS
jgi:hypothetical protein